jgi:predicted dienelactone hydrolase
MKITSLFSKIMQALIAALFLSLMLPLAACSSPALEPTAVENPYPLAEPGPYAVGMVTFSAVDDSRAGREVSITLWYPTKATGDAASSIPMLNAVPDSSGAPYPLLLSSTKLARIFAPFLVSHGFTWASVDKIDYWNDYNEQIVSQPRDILFALDQAADHPPQGLEGIIDADHAGVMGYSFDGSNSWVMSGARIDPDFYLAQCADPASITEALQPNISDWGYCALAEPGAWDAFAAAAGEASTPSDDGLWQPLTDPRIRAAMPMAGDGWLLYGERGLAAVDRPILVIDASEDGVYGENALIFEHLGTPERTFITFLEQDHFMVLESEYQAKMAHFAVAFFGYHLQGREDYAPYFSQEFVDEQDGLAWGVINEQ